MKKNNGVVYLKNTPSFCYLDQVQGSLAVSGLSICHFVIHTKETKVLEVGFDQTYWEQQLLPALKSFWINSVAPAIAGKQSMSEDNVQPDDEGKENAASDTEDKVPMVIRVEVVTPQSSSTVTSKASHVTKPSLLAVTQPLPQNIKKEANDGNGGKPTGGYPWVIFLHNSTP